MYCYSDQFKCSIKSYADSIHDIIIAYMINKQTNKPKNRCRTSLMCARLVKGGTLLLKTRGMVDTMGDIVSQNKRDGWQLTLWVRMRGYARVCMWLCGCTCEKRCVCMCTCVRAVLSPSAPPAHHWGYSLPVSGHWALWTGPYHPGNRIIYMDAWKLSSTQNLWVLLTTHTWLGFCSK